MTERYPFKRYPYYDLVRSVDSNKISFLLGPRKTGKTVCLKQMEDTYENSQYVDFKGMNTEMQMEALEVVYNAIKKGEYKVFLLDEFTYLDNPDLHLEVIADTLNSYPQAQTRIVISGSQSVALNIWMNRSFCGNAGKVYVDFLSYPEFLDFKGITEVSPDSYNRFLFESSDFYMFRSLEEYLSACIDETVISNMKSLGLIFDNDCELLRDNTEVLLNICYQTMFSLHNQVSVGSFFKDNKIFDTIKGIFHELYHELGDKVLSQKIETSFISSYNNIKSQGADVLRQAFIFLKQCGLITITPVVRDLESVPNVYKSMVIEDAKIDCKADLFTKFNITINYPMFYVQILKDILGDDMPRKLPAALVGSIVECQIRGMLLNGFEYHGIDESGVESEIDYVNFSKNLAIEFTISPHHKTHFELLPEGMEFVCLTRNKNQIIGNVRNVDYCTFLYELSSRNKILGQTKQNMNSTDSLKDVDPTHTGCDDMKLNLTEG